MTGNDVSIQAAPTPKEIDRMIGEFAEAQAELQSGGAIHRIPGESTASMMKRLEKYLEDAAADRKKAAEAVDAAKAKLVDAVKAHGHQHAKKSMRLSGVHNQATVTFGTTTAVVAERVEKLRAYAEKSKVPALSGHLFVEHVSYSLVEDPQLALKTMDLKSGLRNKLEAMVARCFTPVPLTPRLTIDVPEVAAPAKSKAA